MKKRLSLVVLLLASLSVPALAEPISEPLRVLAAGSLKAALTNLISQWRTEHPQSPVTLVAGPAGWLRERIEQGDSFDVYASAALTHAEAVHQEGLSGPAVLFAHNTLCATVRSDAQVEGNNIVGYLLKPETRLATSTPKSDPGGDYTWSFFQRLETQHPGAYAVLNAKAQKLYGSAPDPSKPRISVNELITSNKMDVSIGYCSGKSGDGLKKISLPAPSPIADYGLTLSNKATPAAASFALFILSPQGQRTLAAHGFVPVGLPSE
jgi:molybdate transport system substrate-binding protein